MNVYHGAPCNEPALTTGQIPAVRRRRSLLRAFVVLALIAMLGNMLLIEAYLAAGFAPDSAPQQARPADALPAAVRTGGPVIDLTGAKPHTYRMPARTIALTFDDGPDPRWTPQILAVLRRHRAHGTFFVLGTQVTRNAALSRQIVAEGHEIGVHTFTHPLVSALPIWLRTLEHSATQEAIAYTTGRLALLYRPPYSSVIGALDNTDLATLRETGRQGYRTVLNDLDSEDWRRPGVETILRHSTPRDGSGAIVLMHDAGGDRSQIVAALDRLIPRLQARGYRFTAVSEALAGRVPFANPRAGHEQTARGWALTQMIRAADRTLWVLWVLLLGAGALMLARTALLLTLSVGHARRRRGPAWSWARR
ncbi:polysaccharide deacetylase family protein [Paractinoplanes rishiriensis]|uniref:NodB homology domain-containing protein n=1 Tax=Paractinoplanes rishiriensis TaxID=1050105 RepID=A0A919K6D9_9ACTN|nr:polysaccharide deacetylase family protein [Actinoplanes rishiriensis]GIF01777.1 hypothetical protein Ari01nite_92410 [Actinoplanes rishiriensis]